jgi:Protein RETICULATA-related
MLMPPADSAQVIGVGAAVVGDMSTRKDWGIHELDFVFSTVVVCQPSNVTQHSGRKAWHCTVAAAVTDA